MSVESTAVDLIVEGNALEDRGNYAEAIDRYDAALRLMPGFARAHLNRGNALLAKGDAAQSARAYEAAISHDPQYASAHCNLGNARLALKENEAAAAAFRRAIELQPDFVNAMVALGVALERLGQAEGAVEAYQKALASNPAYAEVWANLGDVLRALGRIDEAVASCRRAVELKPRYADGHLQLARVLQDAGRPSEAARSFRQVLEIEPENADAYTALLFCLCHDESIAPAALFDEHRRFGERLEAPLRANVIHHGNTRQPSRRLEIGLVSADLHAHPLAYFLEPLIADLGGRDDLSLHAYSTNAHVDDVTARLRAHFSHWHPIVDCVDQAFAAKIAQDGIDILIDLSGHTANHRLGVFARKAAPLQASWMGYPGTTGLRAMDYYFADKYFLPVERFASQFTERIVHLPSNAPFLPDARAPAVNALPALAKGFVTFGSFNRPSKLTPSVIALWSRLLRAVPDSRMLVGGVARARQPSLRAMFEREGVLQNRLRMYAHCGMQEFLSLHGEVDMCLDTFPYAGGTTTAHALWMGVPTLTIAGDTPAGHQGAALLSPLGLDQFVSRDAADFVDHGRAIAANVEALAEIRAGLRARWEGVAARRPGVIAAGVDRALRIMWQRWCGGLPPAYIDVSAP